MTDIAPLDPDLAAIVATMRAQDVPSPFDMPIAEARARMESAAALRPMVTGIGGCEDAVAEHDGLTVPVRIYRPEAPGDVIALFFHGGGFALGGPASSDAIARRFCRDTGATIVSVDYRLAPEHPFPAAHDDALAATLWADWAVRSPGGRLALIGESAGANLAASTALALRDRGIAVTAQVLVSPGLDLARDVDALEQSGRDFPLLSTRDLRAITRLYLGGRADAAQQCPPSPLRAARLDGVAPAIIAVAGHDPLEAEGLAYAARLTDAGVPVTVLRLPAMFHPFLGFADRSAGAHRAHEAICQSFVTLMNGVEAYDA